MGADLFVIQPTQTYCKIQIDGIVSSRIKGLSFEWKIRWNMDVWLLGTSLFYWIVFIFVANVDYSLLDVSYFTTELKLDCKCCSLRLY